MKLFSAALVGLFSLAVLATGLPDAVDLDKGVVHLDEAGFTYRCEALDIYQCSSAGTCTLFENCEHWCIDLTTPGGAICSDGAPTIVEARDGSGLGFSWENDEEGKYICASLNIDHCHYKDNYCHTVESCPKGCFQTSHSALCVDKANTESPPDNIPISNLVTARDGATTAQFPQGVCEGDGADRSKECRQCTNDRSGVLTCQYGFCYVKPGDWCKDGGWSCSDDGNICKKNRKRGKLVTKAAETPKKGIISLDRKDDLADEGPGKACYYGKQGYMDCHHDTIVMCHPKRYNWEEQETCEPGCCETYRISSLIPYAARCRCPTKQGKLEAKSVEDIEKVSAPLDREDNIAAQGPPPPRKTYGRCGLLEKGHYNCHNTVLVICDPKWLLWAEVAVCNGCCSTFSTPEIPHGAQCKCSQGQENVEVKTIEILEDKNPKNTYGPCSSSEWGHKFCQKNRSVISVCDPKDSVWRETYACLGGNGCCEHTATRDNPNDAICRC